MYDYDICQCFLNNHGHLIFVLIPFIINSPLQFLYHVMIVNLRLWEQMDNSRLRGVRFFCWSCQANVITLKLFWERVVLC